MSMVPAICTFCRHRGEKGPNGPTCAAYPDGIPRDIIMFEADHRRPMPGDRGIQFEAREDAAPDMLSWSLQCLDEAMAHQRRKPRINAARSGANVR